MEVLDLLPLQIYPDLFGEAQSSVTTAEIIELTFPYNNSVMAFAYKIADGGAVYALP